MNKALRGFLNLIVLYAKVEIVVGLLLVILFLGYFGFSSHHSDRSPSIRDKPSTLQE